MKSLDQQDSNPDEPKFSFQISNTNAEVGLFSNLETLISQLLETAYIGPNELSAISERWLSYSVTHEKT